MNAQNVHVIRVNIGQRRRTVDRQKVKGLAESITEIGLLNPITVREVGDEYTLVAGRHRLEAAKQLGWSKIPAVIVELDDVDRMLAEIDENLIRNDLSDLERSEHLAERKRLYLLKHPETAKGIAGGKARQGSASEMISFAADSSQKIGRTVRSVEQDVQIAESIPSDVRDAIRETPLADSKTDLLEMARLPQDAQREIVQTADLTDKASVREAIAARKPAPRRSADSQDITDDQAFAGQQPSEEPASPAGDDFSDVVNNEPKTHGAPERFCSACGDRYRGDACPCATAAEPEPHPSAATYQPAPRTSSVSVGRQPIAPTRAPSGPAPLTIQGDAGDAMRAVADRWTLDRVAEWIGETYSEAERRSLAIQLIDALPTPLLGTVKHRLDVRLKAQTSAPTTFEAIDQAIVAHLTTEQRTALMARELNRIDAVAQRKVFEMLAARFSLAVAG